MKHQATFIWVAVLLLAAAAGAFWWTQRDLPAVAPPPAEPPAPSAPAAADQEPAAPRFPVEPPPPASPEEPPPDPLPALADSDSLFAAELADLFGDGMTSLLVETALIEKIVASVDNLPRAQVAEKIRPLGPLLGSFTVAGQDGSGEFTLDTDNYERYGFFVNLLARANIDELASSYRRFYPLFQEAYVNLGYPDGHFNDRAVEVIDHLLETPDPDDPIALVRPHVMYEFADPELEALSSGQKLLIRAGAEHRVRLKQFLEEFREAITAAGAAE